MDNSDNTMNSFSTERKCPICRGKLKVFPIPSEEMLKKYGIPNHFIFDKLFYGRPYGIKDIKLQKGDLLSLFRVKTLAAVVSIRVCEKCDRVWDMFDEVEFVLNSNNQEIIQKYTLLAERSTELLRGLSLNNLSPKVSPDALATIKERHWIINLIKARLYQYQYKNQSNNQSNDDLDYNHPYLYALQEAEKYHTDNQNLLSYEYELKAGMCDDDDILQRFYYLNAALTSDMSTHRKVKIKNIIGEIYSAVLERWKEPISVDKRRIIFIANNLDDIAGYYDPTNSIKHYFTIDRIPAIIKFPYGQPTGNGLYIANPVKPDEYIPYENHEELLFMDKIRELRRLLRYLGATEITFTAIKGKSIEEIQREGQKASVDVSLFSHKASGDYGSEDSQNRKSSQDIRVDYIERLDPYKYPSLPDNLHWYNDNLVWKDFVEPRLHHNQLHFEQTISTKQVSSLTEQSQLDINAAYEGLISKINANHHREREFHVETTEETMWRITAEYKPMSEFKNNVNVTSGKANTILPDEQKYLDLVKKSCANGEISDLNRKMLEQIRIKLSISEERALELTASLIPQLSEEEKEYLDAVREYLADGTIGENEREILQTLRELNNISEERANELEAMA